MKKIIAACFVCFMMLFSQGYADEQINISIDAQDTIIKQETTSLPPKMLCTDSTSKEIECSRFITKKGDKLRITVMYTDHGIKPEISVKETSRSTELESNFSFLASKVMAAAAPPGKGTGKKEEITTEYTLEKTRAELAINVNYYEQESGSTTVNKSQAYESKTGPTEHWFMSVDMPVNNANQLKYDETKGELVEKEVPSSFYIGINCMYGDVLSEHLSMIDKLHLKFMIKASEKPLDSAGVGIGYRLDEFNFTKDNKLGQTTIFAGYFWDKEDQIEDGVVKENNRYTNNWRFGISFALDKLSSWIK